LTGYPVAVRYRLEDMSVRRAMARSEGHCSGSGTVRTAAVFFVIAAVLTAVAAAQTAQQTEGLIVKDVRIVGLKVVPEAFVRARLRTRPGMAYSEAAVRADLRRLLETGKFAAVDAGYTIEEGQVVVTFRIREKPLLKDIRFVGNKRISTKDLLAEVNLKPGDPIDLFLLRQAVENIQQLYRQSGYHYVRVTLDEQRLTKEGVAVFRIVEGPRVKIRKILFEGNRAFRASRLSRVIETKTYIPLLRTGIYDPEAISRDEVNIANFYRDNGYLDVRVSHRLEFAENREDLTVVFLIDEGPQYFIKEVQFEGNTVLSDSYLAGLMKLQSGSPLLQDVLKSDLRAIRDAYGQRGYIYAQVRASWIFLKEPARVRLVVHIEEGPRIRVGRIVIRGNERTQDRVIRRQLRLYPGEYYNSREQQRARVRLIETGLFEQVDITPVGQQDNVRDVLVRVKEAQTVQFLIGVGVTSNSGVLGNLMIENRNFDITRWPRSWGEFFRGQAFRGGGQLFRLQLEPGTELTRFRIVFREPYLFDKPISLGTSAYLFQRGRDAYAEERLGFTLSLGKRHTEGIFRNWGTEAAARWEWIDITDVDWFDAEDIRESAGSNYLSTLRLSLVRDTTDSRWFPSVGSRFALSWEQAGVFGGDWTFSKVIAGYNWYKTLRVDVFDRKTIFATRARVGYIFGDAPVFERFYGGGIGSIRGFDFRGVTPRAGIRRDRVGGDFEVLTGAELSFPLFGKELRGVVFTDMGTVEEDFEFTTWRISAGFGIRVVVQFFGPVPLSFDFAWPLAKDDEDDTQVFSFTFGTVF